MIPLCGIVTPIGMLGYGLDQEELLDGLRILSRQNIPASIICDSGSTDSGPGKLAQGTMTCPRPSYKRDLDKLLQAVKVFRVPVLIGSAGGDGSDEHVREFVEILREIVAQPEHTSTKLKVVAIYSGISHATVLENLEAGRIAGCGPCVPTLTVQAVEETPRIVGQMGPEPYLQVLAAHPDVDFIIGGRAYDPVPYVAFCAYHHYRLNGVREYHPVLSLERTILGGFTHMGKIMECGGQCATPKSASALATIYPDGAFDVRPLHPGARCTTLSVAAHTLYEKSYPDHLHGPGGYIDLTSATYTALADNQSVRVTGTVFCPSRDIMGGKYTLKLEGARNSGFRTVIMGSFCDPILVSQLPDLLARVRAYVEQQHAKVKETWELGFHTYGLDGEGKSAGAGSSEIFVVGEALGETQAVATSVASTARIALIHGPYVGQKATSGNMGFGIGGRNEMEVGQCAEFSLYHLMDLQNGEEEAAELGSAEAGKKLFKWETFVVGEGEYIPPGVFADKPSATTNYPAAITDSDASSVQPLIGTMTVGQLARVVRSKNAGPYEITIDIIFDSIAVYQQVKSLGILTADLVASLYKIDVGDLVYCGFFDQALAFKVTFPRLRDGQRAVSGGFMENDVHGSQKYMPLAGVKLDFGA